LTIPDTGASAEVLPVLEEIYARVKKVSRELRPSDRIARDLGIDSVATLEILIALEERFGVELAEDPRVARIDTVADLAALLDDVRAQEKP
jgi:acyl carrier protein